LIEQIAVALGVKSNGLLAGFFGALVSTYFAAKSWTERLIMAFSGTLCAAYITPVIGEYFKASERQENGLAFAVGLFGMTLAGAIVQTVRETKFGEQLATWLKRPGA
jgi:hypothetical protein